MRNSIQLILILVVWASVSVWCQTGRGQSDDLKFPFQALVLREGATVHSGPGQVHYATEKLEQGDSVQVYREDPGGWCAIRPTSGSFSLVPESTLDLVDDGIGEIVEDGTQAWVGTKLGAVDQPLWQVKLQAGELVSVLGQVSWPSPEGHSTIWYQIAPPAGEFRWIKISDLQLPAVDGQPDSRTRDQRRPDSGVASRSYIRQPEPQTTSSNSTVRSLNELVGSPALPNQSSSEIQMRDRRQSSVEPSGGAPSLSQPEVHPVQQAGLLTEYVERPAQTQGSVNQGWRQATRPIREVANSSPHDGTQLGRSLESPFSRSEYGDSQFDHRYDESVRVADADMARQNLARNLSQSRSNLPNENFSLNDSVPVRRSTSLTTMRDLEFQLTGEMLKEPPKWQLDDLEVAATSIRNNSGADSSERQLAEKFLSKLSNCKTIRAGYRSALNTGTQGDATDSRPIGTGVDLNVELGTTYDAHGWLKQIVRDGGINQAEYVLQDDNEKIIFHVSPAPGLNLHRYLNSRVGIIGKRGYHSKFKLDHVTAQRLVELEKR